MTSINTAFYIKDYSHEFQLILTMLNSNLKCNSQYCYCILHWHFRLCNMQ